MKYELQISAAMLCAVCLVVDTTAQERLSDSEPRFESKEILSEDEWARLDRSVSRAMSWLIEQQEPDGSYPCNRGQPGLTSLVTLSLLSHGIQPGEGRHGQEVKRSIDFIVRCAQPNGLIFEGAPNRPVADREAFQTSGVAIMYSHAISALTLSEVYTLSESVDNKAIESAVRKALRATLAMQEWSKESPNAEGGWRYFRPLYGFDSDLSVTGWQLMFLRSAKNAGFSVPEAAIDKAVAYVKRCFQPKYGTFNYSVTSKDQRGRGIAGAGVLALAHAGENNTIEAKTTGQWILAHPFDRYNEIEWFTQEGHAADRYHNGVMQCSHGMFQLGGKYWREFFPPMARVLIENQKSNGSWPAESHKNEKQLGSIYSTSLALLALSAPNQLLPIFQR